MGKEEKQAYVSYENLWFGLGVQGLKAYAQAFLPVSQMLWAAMKNAVFFLVESLWRILFIVYKLLVLLVGHAVKSVGILCLPHLQMLESIIGRSSTL